jgi:hypothetical protein
VFGLLLKEDKGSGRWLAASCYSVGSFFSFDEKFAGFSGVKTELKTELKLSPASRRLYCGEAI